MTLSRRNLVVAALSLLLLILCAFGWGVVRKIQLDNGSGEFAINVLQSALESESADSLVNNAHAEWLSYMSPEEIQEYLALNLRLLGSLRALISITGESAAPVLPLPNTQVDAHYVIDLQMELAQAEAIIDLRFENGSWFITAFDFESQLLMQ